MLGWYLLYCRGRKEATARAHFERQNIGCFLPEAEVACIKRGKRTTELVPLFPNYLFVRFDPHLTSVRSVLATPGVSSLVRTDGQMLPVDTSLVVALRQRLAQSRPQLEQQPQPGERVAITDGPFADLEAVFAEPDGEKRSLLLLELMGQVQRMSVDNLSFKRL
ncbi:transcription/translation regulatory transformer protein RfaH [Ferrimonas balearica]|uniref:transcription/translation regulatory transformer protein RfaH n=1 Tax=Ferrimonas balearica TaxID=44012 RepID=UPI001C999460|nr:transcription/translation regulatory transformer protein RfaH [Ferrimonas balearica]MBY5990764.1 transcription/translation regulatory transformer protein RfaH [Ferrimonas balearica]